MVIKYIEIYVLLRKDIYIILTEKSKMKNTYDPILIN